MTDDMKMLKGRNALSLIIFYNALCEVLDYVYDRDCIGLTFEECETLEDLCTKASDAIEIDFADKCIKENERKRYSS